MFGFPFDVTKQKTNDNMKKKKKNKTAIFAIFNYLYTIYKVSQLQLGSALIHIIAQCEY